MVGPNAVRSHAKGARGHGRICDHSDRFNPSPGSWKERLAAGLAAFGTETSVRKQSEELGVMKAGGGGRVGGTIREFSQMIVD